MTFMNSIRFSLFGLFLPLLLIGACTPENKSESKNETAVKEPATTANSDSSQPVLVLHGGAGYMVPEKFNADQIAAYKTGLKTALTIGYAVLEKGGTSEEAVIKAIQTLEQDSLFNAGIGAVLTHDKTVSLDASFMNGATGQAGAVAGVSTVKSPIELAYTVMKKSKHVMLSGEGAEQFAQQNKLPLVDPSYFITSKRWQQINKILEEEAENTEHAFFDPYIQNKKMGTVGAVALDKYGDLAAGTSTGGMANKKHGRIGDSPIIGAGTFAENSTCAVSATGHGEFFIRNVVAYDVAAQMKYQNKSLKDAAQTTINQLEKINGDGGIIALDQKGNIAMPFNTKGMFRAYAKPNGEVFIEIFGEK